MAGKASIECGGHLHVVWHTSHLPIPQCERVLRAVVPLLEHLIMGRLAHACHMVTRAHGCQGGRRLIVSVLLHVGRWLQGEGAAAAVKQRRAFDCAGVHARVSALWAHRPQEARTLTCASLGTGHRY